MPIKFRCSQCRQFLGISRSKAGEVVDCPTCGRSIRVPLLDGTREPVPEPELNLDDQTLSTALDAIAAIGTEKEASKEKSKQTDATSSEAPAVKTVEPLPTPKPIPVDPIQPQVIAPPPNSATVQYSEPAANGDRLEELARLNRQQASSSPAATKPFTSEFSREFTPQPVTGRRSASVALLLVAVVTLAIGFVAGRYSVSSNGDRKPDETNQTTESKEESDAKSFPATKTAIRGQITYHTKEGVNRPDAGARIVVFLEERTGGISKHSFQGFLAGADVSDFNTARSFLRNLKGDLVLADENGEFHIELPKAGTYRVLVVSRFHSRTEDEAIPESLRSFLAKYIDRPDSLFGKLAFHSQSVKYNGSSSTTLNHTFE